MKLSRSYLVALIVISSLLLFVQYAQCETEIPNPFIGRSGNSTQKGSRIGKILDKVDPEKKRTFNKDQYKEILKSYLLGSGTLDIENMIIFNELIDEYVDKEATEITTMQQLLKDIETGKLMGFFEKAYKRKLNTNEL
jgi:hypothetical protein